MQQTDIQAAAQVLCNRRLKQQVTGPLAPELRPASVDDALAIQQQLTLLMEQAGDRVAGWKCALPIEIDGLKNVPVVAPIFRNSTYTDSPCPIQLDQGVCKSNRRSHFVSGMICLTDVNLSVKRRSWPLCPGRIWHWN